MHTRAPMPCTSATPCSEAQSPSPRARSPRARPPRRWHLTLSAGLITLIGAGTLFTGAGHIDMSGLDAARNVSAVAASPSTDAATTKFYIVSGSVNGQREYLFAIALKTLGDGNRYVEIFKLNQGRLQPDGLRMTDPTVVEPGWVLVLPPDAKGPDVKEGPLPSPPAEFAGDRPPAPYSTDNSNGAVRMAGVVAIVMLLVWALLALRRGARLSLPLSNRTVLAPLLAGSEESEHREAARVASATADTDVLPDPHVRTNTRVRPDTSRPDTSRPDTSRPDSLRTDSLRTDSLRTDSLDTDLPGTDNETSEARLALGRTELTTASSRPAMLRAEVVSGPDAMIVSLAGVRATSEPAPACWLYAEAAPYGSTLAALGRNRRGILYVDLAHAPDVITITGPQPSCQRQALSLARQLVGNGVAVTVVGDPFGAPAAGCRFFSTVDDAVQEATGATAGLRVMFCDGAIPADIATIRQAVAVPMPRLVPVLVGDVPRARWSIHVQPTSMPPEGDRSAPDSTWRTGSYGGAQVA